MATASVLAQVQPESCVAAVRAQAGSLGDARSAIDTVLSQRGWRGKATEHAVALRLVAATASARLDGASGPEDASAMGVHVRAVRLLTDEVHVRVDDAVRAPAMVLARLHVVATSTGHVPEEHRGRPRVDDMADDPLRLGPAPRAEDAQRLLSEALRWMTSDEVGDVPGLARAAIVHGLLAIGRPFRDMSGPVARAAGRLVMAARGVDPDGLIPVEAGIEAVGRAGYVRALRAWMDGDLEAWLDFHAQAVIRAAMLADDQVNGRTR